MSKGKKYPMGESQPAQIDCRNIRCSFYEGAGKCSNVSPAITLNENKTFVCWSADTTEMDICNMLGSYLTEINSVDGLADKGKIQIKHARLIIATLAGK